MLLIAEMNIPSILDASQRKRKYTFLSPLAYASGIMEHGDSLPSLPSHLRPCTCVPNHYLCNETLSTHERRPF